MAILHTMGATYVINLKRIEVVHSLFLLLYIVRMILDCLAGFVMCNLS